MSLVQRLIRAFIDFSWLHKDEVSVCVWLPDLCFPRNYLPCFLKSFYCQNSLRVRYERVFETLMQEMAWKQRKNALSSLLIIFEAKSSVLQTESIAVCKFSKCNFTKFTFVICKSFELANKLLAFCKVCFRSWLNSLFYCMQTDCVFCMKYVFYLI